MNIAVKLSALLMIFVSSIAFAADVILDVRTPEEYAQSHVQGAVNIDVKSSDFDEKIKKFDRAASYKVYCKSGNRAGMAEKKMIGLGFKKVENLGSAQQASKALSRKCEGLTESC